MKSQTSQDRTGRIRSVIKRFQPLVEVAICIALGGFLFWKGILPAWKTLNTDFPNYYLVARLLREGYRLDQIYDWVWLQRIKDHWGVNQSLVGFTWLTPISALPVYPLTAFSALTAKRIWIVVNVALLAGGVEMLQKVTQLGRRRLWLLTLLSIFPLRTSFLYGQMHILALFCLTLAWYFHKRERDSVSGFLIAFAGALKIYPLLFWVYFFWKRQWKALAASVIGFSVLTVAAESLMGRALFHTYATQILPASLRGDVSDPYVWHYASGSALLHWLFLYEPTLNPNPLHPSPGLYAILYPIWQAFIFVPLLALIRPSSGDREQLEWAAFLVSLLILSPVPASYHFVVMILPVSLFVDFLLRHRRQRAAAAVVCLYAAMSVADMFPSPAPHVSLLFFGFARLWIELLIYALFLSALWKTRVKDDGSMGRRRLVWLGLAATCAILVSVKSYRNHFSDRETQMRGRLPVAPATYMETAPHPIGGDIFSVAMVSKGYRVVDRLGHQVFPVGSPDADRDQLSFAVRGGDVAVEIADATGSRIIRTSDRAVLAENAESPAFSADGHLLAFVREVKGEGSLWMVPSDSPSLQGVHLATPVRLTDGGYDVRSAAFLHSGDLLFAAEHDGHRSLFLLATSGKITQLSPASEEIGSFAVSPDERNLAFSMLTGNVWRLAIKDISSKAENLVTTGDCNADHPAWSTNSRIIYATDCGRGLGLTALAEIDVPEASQGRIN